MFGGGDYWKAIPWVEPEDIQACIAHAHRMGRRLEGMNAGRSIS